METSTYGSEMVALRIALEALTKVRHKLSMMGIDFYNQSHVLCEKKIEVWNMKLPSSSLKKNLDSVAYQKCRKSVTARIVAIGNIGGKQNMSDLLTKPLGPEDYYKLLSRTFFGRESWVDHTSGGVVE